MPSRFTGFRGFYVVAEPPEMQGTPGFRARRSLSTRKRSQVRILHRPLAHRVAQGPQRSGGDLRFSGDLRAGRHDLTWSPRFRKADKVVTPLNRVCGPGTMPGTSVVQVWTFSTDKELWPQILLLSRHP